jgi:hypothetical protein
MRYGNSATAETPQSPATSHCNGAIFGMLGGLEAIQDLVRPVTFKSGERLVHAVEILD